MIHYTYKKVSGKEKVTMEDTTRQRVQHLVRQVDVVEVGERERPSQDQASSPPTARQFYDEFAAREDVRAILKRLADS